MLATALNSVQYPVQDNDLIMGESIEYVLRIRDLPLDRKPRERLASDGPADLTMAELISIVLGVGTRREEVLTMSRRIVNEYGQRALATEVNPTRLSESLDIPIAKASQIVACFELGRRFYDERAGRPVYVRTAEQAYVHLRQIARLQKEHFRGIYLNSRYQVIHEETISVGSLTANVVHPREVFKPAIEYGAVAVIVAHNHPSGDVSPTDADYSVTSQLVATGKILGIELLDHLVIVADRYESIIKRTNTEEIE